MIEVANFSPFQRQIPMMHEAKGMMAMEGSRITSSASLTPLQPVPQEMHTSVIRKTYDPASVVPVSAIETQDDQNNRYNEQMDEDEFSDHDSHYSEDFVDDIDDVDVEEEETVDKPPDMTKQLLDFADMANADIKKFFGRRKDEEDYCDIYENKWNVTKSGRELYYADLMKIVHGEDKGRKYSSASSASPPLLDISNSNPAKQVQDNRSLFSGKQDKKIGLGPLEELFDVGLRHFLSERKNKLKEPKRFRVDNKKIESVTPMQSRKLPSSFWHEPGCQSSDLRRNGGTSVIHSNNPPDFSDLLDSWRLDRHDFSGDVSSSDVSLSPESGMDHT